MTSLSGGALREVYSTETRKHKNLLHRVTTARNHKAHQSTHHNTHHSTHLEQSRLDAHPAQHNETIADSAALPFGCEYHWISTESTDISLFWFSSGFCWSCFGSVLPLAATWEPRIQPKSRQEPRIQPKWLQENDQIEQLN